MYPEYICSFMVVGTGGQGGGAIKELEITIYKSMYSNKANYYLGVYWKPHMYYCTKLYYFGI